jgi:hypothetical protein
LSVISTAANFATLRRGSDPEYAASQRVVMAADVDQPVDGSLAGVEQLTTNG